MRSLSPSDDDSCGLDAGVRDDVLGTMQRFLSYRDRSIAEARRYIESKELLPDEKVEEMLGFLIEQRFLDDERFARNRAEYRARSGYGPRYIKRELQSSGVERDVIDAAIADIPDEHFLIGLERQLRGQDPKSQKLQNRLLRRGFPTTMLQRLFAEMAATEADNGQDSFSDSGHQ